MAMTLQQHVRDLEVVALGGEGSRWDEFVSQARGSSFCHLVGWREILTDVLGHECIYLVARDHDGEWRGVLPLARVRSRLFGDYLLSMPFLNYGGPIGSEAARSRLARSARERARRLGVDLLELRNRDALRASLRESRHKIIVLLDLPPDPETLWREEFPSKLRSQIRRPRKVGMEPAFGPEHRDAFYEVFSRNMRDLGTPVLPRAVFDRISTVFEDRVVFGVVYWDDVPVAAGCGFVWKAEFEMTWASAIRDYNRHAPNMLLYWSFMERMIEDGVTTFNFGRCTSGTGTHRFKKQWGGRDLPLPWAQWSSGKVSATPSPDGGVFGLASALWSRFPVALANRVGPILARQLP